MRFTLCVLSLVSVSSAAELFDETTSTEFNQPYATGGCRSITSDGYIIGSFTELEGSEMKKVRGGKVWFFKIKAEKKVLIAACTMRLAAARVFDHPLGMQCDHGKDGKGVKWSSGAQFAVHRGDQQWSIEMRLPITGEGSRMIDPLKGIDGAMPKDLFPWHFNVCRQRVRGTTIERTAFSATGKDDFYVPEKFAKLWGKGK